VSSNELGTLEYNGYAFGERTQTSVSEELVYDDADRTVVYHNIKLNAKTIVTPDGNDSDTNRSMQKVRELLTQAGARLKIDNRGFGTKLDINGSGVKDVAFGPKPRMLSWVPVGNDQAAEVEWECETRIPFCQSGSSPRYTGFSTFNYTIDYSISDKGFTTRTIAGYIEIAMTRNGRNLPDTADRYREKLRVLKPRNFKRSQDFSLSADKRRLNFTFVDTEIESQRPYPPGVVEISGRHRVRWDRSRIKRIGNTFSLDVEVAHDKPKLLAWEIFNAMLTRRLDKVRESNRTVFLEGLDIDEDLFTNRISFSVNYRVQADLSEIFNLSGLFNAPNYDWRRWEDSMNDIHSLRGISKLSHSQYEDRITDLCDQHASTFQFVDRVYIAPTAQPPKLCNKKPPASKSWLYFDASLTNVDDTNTYFEHTLGSAPITDEAFDPSATKTLPGTVDLSNIDTVVAIESPNMYSRDARHQRGH
jgi:hypothetical protein